MSFSEQVLDIAANLKGLTWFRGELDEPHDWLIVSAEADDGTGASCRRAGGKIRCFDFAGYSREHLMRVFRSSTYPVIPTPT